MAGQTRDSKGRFISMKVKVEVEDKATPQIGNLEKKVQTFGGIMSQAAGAAVVFGLNLRKSGSSAVEYSNKIDGISKALQQSNHLSERIAGSGLGLIARSMHNSAQAAQGLGTHITLSGAAIGRMGRLVVSTITPFAQWGDKSKLVNTYLTAMQLRSRAAMIAAQGLGMVGWKAIQGVGNAAKWAYNHLGGLNGIINHIRGGIMGLVGGITGGPLDFAQIAKVNGEYENLQNDLAQTLALSSGKSFNEELGASEALMGRLVKVAGPLPGTAKDYGKAFALSATTVTRAVGDQETAFQMVKDMTAAWGGDGVMAAKMLNQALDPTGGKLRAGSKNAMDLLRIMRSLPGQANISAAAFNKMSLDKRVKIFQGALEKYQDKIKAMAQTYEAKMGAAQETWSWLLKAMSPDIFNTMKAGLDAFNDAILDSEGKFTPFAQSVIDVGKNISKFIVGGIRQATEGAKRLYGWFVLFTKSESFAKLSKTAMNLVNAVSKSGQGLLKGAGGMDAMQTRAANLFAAITNQVAPFIDKLSQVAEPLFIAIGTVAGVIYDSVWPALVGMMQGINAVTGPLVNFGIQAYEVVTVIANTLRPHLVYAGEAIGALGKGLGDFLAPIVRLLGGVLIRVYQGYANYLVPVLGRVVSAFAALTKGLGSLLSWIGKKIGQALWGDDIGKPIMDAIGAMSANVGPQWWENTATGVSTVAGPDTLGGGEQKVETPDGRGGGGKTVQDFRYSRFDISQKFEEGFDPDRIATVFSENLSRIGDRRLQSGFDPMFALR